MPPPHGRTSPQTPLTPRVIARRSPSTRGSPGSSYHQFNDVCPTSREDGEKVRVVYVRSQPTIASVDGEVWSAVVFLGLVAAGLLGACVAFSIKAWRARS